MATHQASLSLGLSRQEHRSGLPFPSPFPNICTRKTKISCGSLHCNSHFIAVVWNQTQKYLHDQPVKEKQTQRDEEASASVSHIWQVNARGEMPTQGVDLRTQVYNQTQSTGPFWTQSTATRRHLGTLVTISRPVLGPVDERGRHSPGACGPKDLALTEAWPKAKALHTLGYTWL